MALMTALTAFGSLVRISLLPVPFSLQSLFPLVAGTLFTPAAAALTQALYLLLGLLGLPLFSQGGGLAYLLQPTFGYLLAMPLTAMAAAWGIRRLARPPQIRHLFGLLFGAAVFLLVFGTIWLYVSMRWVAGITLPLSRLLWIGFLPFLPGEALKALAAAWIGHRLTILRTR